MLKNYIKVNHPSLFNLLKNIKYKLNMIYINFYKYFNNFVLFRRVNYIFNLSFKKFSVYKYLNKDSIFIDIGANIGLYSLYVNDNFKSQVICFEPHPDAFKILNKRFKNNSKAKIYNKAVSDHDGKEDLYLHQNEGDFNEDFSESASLYYEKFNVDPKKKIEIETVDIKKIIDSFEFIDCIKINAEGVEFKILPQIIENHKKIGKVFCAFHDKKISGIDHLYQNIINDLNQKKLLNKWFYEME